MRAENPLASDLDAIVHHTGGLLAELRNQRLFLTGGTGFFGCWLLESFAWANEKLDLDATAVVLTRSADAFRRKAPHLCSQNAIELYEGDVRSFAYPPGQFGYVIHAATPSGSPDESAPLEMLDVMVNGTRHTLDFAAASATRKFLLTSSGAVYGNRSANLDHVQEDDLGAPDTMDPESTYGEGKRVAELLCSLYHRTYGLETKIARCFAFAGPYLPLDAHFAFGNFIRDALSGGPIRVSGDGAPYRSYLYASDLAVWLWTILLKGQSGRPYNVGSEAGLSIGELAQRVARVMGGVAVELARQPDPRTPPPRYVPSAARARVELGLAECVPLDEAIRRTARWAREERV